MVILIDESGDLGFDFTKKRTSKHFVITLLVLPTNAETDRVRRGVKRTIRATHRKRPPKHPTTELKGAKTSARFKKHFWEQVSDIDFSIYAIVLNKQRVNHDLRRVPDRLYNYLARKVIDQLPVQGVDELIVTIDRSKSRREIEDFNNYVAIYLKGAIDPRAVLSINHVDSQQDKAVQAVDLFCWGGQEVPAEGRRVVQPVCVEHCFRDALSTVDKKRERTPQKLNSLA